MLLIIRGLLFLTLSQLAQLCSTEWYDDILSYESKRTWREVVYCKVLSQHLSGRNEGNYKISHRIISLWTMT
jgi:hypothetical protein